MPLTFEAYKACLHAWLSQGDEGAYHSLIDCGGDCAKWLQNDFRVTTSLGHRAKIIKVAKEVSNVHTYELLLTGLFDSDKRIWMPALEGLAYQNYGQLRDRLLLFRQSLDMSTNRQKIERLDNVLSGLV